jgi:5-carboxymethyl-2-hydroxymuconate isomerase
MPHIHLMTSADLVENVEIPDILRELVEELSSQETIEPQSIKAYHNLFHTWSMGKDAPTGFVHCEVRILSNRPDEVKLRIADAMYARLLQCFIASVTSGEVSPTFELREMDREIYRK